MFNTIKHHLMSASPLSGLIQSHEGDIYIAQLIGSNGQVISQNKHHFHSLVEARHWLKVKGAQSIALQPSMAYFEMINSQSS